MSAPDRMYDLDRRLPEDVRVIDVRSVKREDLSEARGYLLVGRPAETFVTLWHALSLTGEESFHLDDDNDGEPRAEAFDLDGALVELTRRFPR